MNALLDELTWRGFVAESTDVDALAAHLDSGPVTSYVGFDPTAASLHIGHLMQLLVARRFQEAGHRPILLVGGATGLIGDPKMTGERVMNETDVVHEWAERLRAQVSRFVSFEGSNAAIVENNYSWTSQMSALDFLREVGKHFSVNRMLARDVVARRLTDGISYTEFSYVLLQSLDYRELYRRHGDAVFGLANRVICDRHIAEEVLQDTFVRLWNSPERFDPERGTLRTYLLRMTHSRSVDRIRSEQARRDREERHEVDLATTRPPADIEREAWEMIRSDNIRNALEELSVSERDAIVLAYFGGRTYREVATQLSIPEGTAKSRIRLGLAKLASHLEAAGLGVQT